MATNLVTGSIVEVLNDGATPNARITGSAIEVLSSGANPNAKITAVAVEVLSAITTVASGPKVRSFGVIII